MKQRRIVCLNPRCWQPGSAPASLTAAGALVAHRAAHHLQLGLAHAPHKVVSCVTGNEGAGRQRFRRTYDCPTCSWPYRLDTLWPAAHLCRAPPGSGPPAPAAACNATRPTYTPITHPCRAPPGSGPPAPAPAPPGARGPPPASHGAFRHAWGRLGSRRRALRAPHAEALAITPRARARFCCRFSTPPSPPHPPHLDQAAGRPVQLRKHDHVGAGERDAHLAAG